MVRKYIGADIGGTSIKLGIVDDSGSVLLRREKAYRDRGPDVNVLEVLIECIHEMLTDNGMDISSFSGIGVSAAGCINSVKGSVAVNGGNIPNWSHSEVCGELRREFGIPATLANDGNCAVMGELWTGAAKGFSDVLGVTLGTGVGGGVITGGRLLEGSRGYAGEIGHFPTHAGGDSCVCGLKGCFERYASTSALTRRTSAERSEWDNGRIFFEAVEEGDETAVSLLNSWIDEIAYGIAGFVHVFDPQIILIGGGVSVQEELLIKPLRERVLSLVMPDFAEGLEFRPATLGNDAGMVGAVYYFKSKENISEDM